MASDFCDARSRLDRVTGLPSSYYPTRVDIWESLVAIPRFQGDRLVEIELYPVTWAALRLPGDQPLTGYHCR